MRDVPAMLDEIRKRFVGSGEEHDVLREVFSEYRNGFYAGKEAAEEAAQAERQSASFDTAMATFVVQQNHRILDFRSAVQSNVMEEWEREHAVAFLRECDAKPDRLRELADAIEKGGAQ